MPFAYYVTNYDTLYIRSGNASPLVPLKVTPNVYSSRGGWWCWTGGGKPENKVTWFGDCCSLFISRYVHSNFLASKAKWHEKLSGNKSLTEIGSTRVRDNTETWKYTAKLSSLGVIFACHGCCCCYYLLPPPEQGTGNSLEQHTIHYLAIWPRITFTKDQRPCIRSWTRPDSIWVRLADGYVHIPIYGWAMVSDWYNIYGNFSGSPSIAGVYITLRTHYATDRLGTIIRSS